jgi:phosphoribosylglycinamide formyltransferase-1
MVALADACAAPAFPAQMALVLSNVADAPGLDIAAERGIATEAVPHGPYRGDRAAHERAIADILDRHAIDLVCLAGYMRLLSPWLVTEWRDRIINIHPSLLPAFKGLETHARVLEAGSRWHGCTVHFVREAMDEGPIIAQAAVPVAADDDADSLNRRVLAAEHRLYPHALGLVASGAARVEGERVVMRDHPLPDTMINPPEASV